MTDDTAALPRRRLPRAERETRMLDAAQHVFGERGFRGASMDEIAEESGITKALLYQYFDSKEGLYEAASERARALLFEDIQAAVAAVEPGAPALRVFAERYFEYLDHHRGAKWLLYAESSTAAANVMRERNAAVIVTMLADTLVVGDLDAADDEIEFLAHALVGLGEQVGRWWTSREDVPRAEVVERLIALAGGAIAGTFARSAKAAR